MIGAKIAPRRRTLFHDGGGRRAPRCRRGLLRGGCCDLRRRLDLLALVVDPDLFPFVAPELLLSPPLLPRGHRASLARFQRTALDDDAGHDLAAEVVRE